jgi:peroxiredoxin
MRMFPSHKPVLLSVFALFAFEGAAQHIAGALPPASASDGLIRLSMSRGSTTRLVDSAAIATDGRFAFADRPRPVGFYHLSINDTDQVDIILDPSEKHVEIDFSGIPLQQHVVVKRSDENRRLWEYKLVSKESQAVQASAVAEKQKLQANDTERMLQLDSVSARAIALQRAYLEGIINGYPKSYFAKVIKADRGVDDAREQNPLAVMKALDFSDPSLMRSAVYDKAVLTFLRNIHASAEEQFISASDSLLVYAGRDPECRAYMLDHLIDLYSTYGPALPLQYLIDKYVVSPEGVAALDPSLHAKVAELLKVRVGADAPDVDLPASPAPLPLRTIVGQNRFTALFFYSSTCEHCHIEMPTMKEVYAAFKPKGLEVIGIALDADSTEFQKAIDENGLPWKCYSEFNGWGSQCAKAFQVKATPFFYLLDQRMRIVAKPVDAIALGVWLQENLK